MAELQVEQPKSLIRPKSWSAEVENAYRFQLAGYRDEKEYRALRKSDVSNFLSLFLNELWSNICSILKVDKWPETGFVKKLQRRKDGYFYYYNRSRECPDKDIPKCKIYVY